MVFVVLQNFPVCQDLPSMPTDEVQQLLNRLRKGKEPEGENKSFLVSTGTKAFANYSNEVIRYCGDKNLVNQTCLYCF